MLFERIKLLFFLFCTVYFYNTWSMLDPKIEESENTLPDKTFGKNNFIFKVETQDDIEHLIVNFSSNNIHFTVINNNKNISQYKRLSFDVVPNNIIKHASIAYKNNSTYTFYIAVKTSSGIIFKQDTFVIKKIDFDTSTLENSAPSCTDLFTHNSPIMHMSIVSQKDNNKDTNYLVVGSSYPSIKIYDLKNNQPVNTLHNRFLLGCADNTIIYAKKNTRPITGVGRFIESQKEHQSFRCTLYCLSNFLDKNKERPLINNNNVNNSLVTINRNNYPLIAESDNLLAIFDKDANCIYSINSKNFDTYYADNIPFVQLKSSNKTETVTGETFINRIKNLLENNDFYQYLKSYITIDSYRDYAIKNHPRSQITFATNRFTTAIQDILKVNKSVANLIAELITKNLNAALKNYLNKNLNNLDLLIIDNIQKIKYYITKDYLKINTDQLLLIPENVEVRKKFSFSNLDAINKIYATDNTIFLQQKNNFFGIDLKSKMPIVSSLPLVPIEQPINYVFKEDDYLYILTNTTLKKATLSFWQEKNNRKIQAMGKEKESRNKEALVYAQRFTTLQTIIESIKSTDTINDLKSSFEKTDRFIVNTIDDVQINDRFKYMLLKEILINNFVKPIVGAKIKAIVETNNNTANAELDVNKQKKLIETLTYRFTNESTWIANIKIENAFGGLSSDTMIDNQRIVKRFPTLNIQTYSPTEKQPTPTKLTEALSYYLQLEEENITVQSRDQKILPIENKTFFNYAKNIIIENAKNIKNVEINTQMLSGKIYGSN